MIYQTTVPQFVKMLGNLSAILDKAVSSATDRKFESSVLWGSRLAPDQFNFIRQIQMSCDTVKMCVALLTGKEKEMPAHPDTEQTLPELKARIQSVIDYLGTFTAKDFEGAAERHIARPRWEGKYLTGEEFLVQHALPNFYFHFTTAYAILRHNGVNVGRKDYLGPMPLK